MVMLAANWPDGSKEKVGLKSSLIDLDTLRQQGNKGEGEIHAERLSERTELVGCEKFRCASPNPDKILEIIGLWKQGLTWKHISSISGIPERTARRYLTSMGYKRDYTFVAQKVSEYSKNRPAEHNRKISETRKLKGIAKGENNPNWKGGIDGRFNKIYRSEEYKIWRESVFERDGYTCRGCGAKKCLEAHHILPRRDFAHLIFELRNGITLCIKCHNATINKEYQSANIWQQRV